MKRTISLFCVISIFFLASCFSEDPMIDRFYKVSSEFGLTKFVESESSRDISYHFIDKAEDYNNASNIFVGSIQVIGKNGENIEFEKILEIQKDNFDSYPDIKVLEEVEAFYGSPKLNDLYVIDMGWVVDHRLINFTVMTDDLGQHQNNERVRAHILDKVKQGQYRDW